MPLTLSPLALFSLLPLSLPLGLPLLQDPVQEPVQDPAPTVEEPPAPPPTKIEDLYGHWLNLDGVAIVVNSDILTVAAIDREHQKKQASAKVSTREEDRALRNQISREQVELLLIRQAGEDLGLAPEAVEAHVIGVLRDEQDQAGGAFEMSRKLREDDTTAVQERQDRVDEIYAVSWRRRIAGYVSPGERSPEDRYIRPGTLAQRYKRIGRTGRQIVYLMRAGAQPATYDLQGLLLRGEDYGSLEAARAKADELLAALRADQVDWDEMIDSLGRMENHGLLGSLPIETIARGLDPGDNRLIQFAMESQLDVFSDVIRFPQINSVTGERRVTGFMIYKLLGRQAAHLPGYAQRGVQRDLRRRIENEGDELRWDKAVAELEATAYVWYPGIEEQRAAAATRRKERLAAIEAAREENAEKLRQRVKNQ